LKEKILAFFFILMNLRPLLNYHTRTKCILCNRTQPRKVFWCKLNTHFHYLEMAVRAPLLHIAYVKNLSEYQIYSVTLGIR